RADSYWGFWRAGHFYHADSFCDGVELRKHDSGASYAERPDGAVAFRYRLSVSLFDDFAGADEAFAADISRAGDLQPGYIYYRRRSSAGIERLGQHLDLEGFPRGGHFVRDTGFAY